MATVEITPEEAEVLSGLLEQRLGELSAEIHHSIVSSFTDDLKAKQAALNALKAKIDAAAD